MGEAPETQDEDVAAPEADDDGITDPLTRGDVEAPRAEFEGRKPE